MVDAVSDSDIASDIDSLFEERIDDGNGVDTAQDSYKKAKVSHDLLEHSTLTDSHTKHKRRYRSQEDESLFVPDDSNRDTTVTVPVSIPSSPFRDTPAVTDIEASSEISVDASEDSASDVPTNNPFATIEVLKKARARKMELSTKLPVLQAKGSSPRRKQAEDDPENVLIYKMRAEHNMAWTAIVNELNRQRLKHGEPPTMTDAAVYSRFVRNGPRIAGALGKEGFDRNDYLYLRNQLQAVPQGSHDDHNSLKPAGGIGSTFGSGLGRKRLRDSKVEDQELKGNIRKKTPLDQQHAELENAHLTEELVKAVETVKNNFWDRVAEQLSRTTGRNYDAQAVQSRWKSI
ncbi:hypothetical protein P280DRAFT_43635 [Massarina eburnea CBS 473.64]|uniref:Uncharacterized protein n=1 Tax=Massarina eburnea CBS 473.64 TaxID=1395130 RepID=A0A6A6RVP5_9PLEO|nr:hypothetical protein P280DRAFT_43635 [Massarina eburnea CBS 473.64]